MTRPTSIILFFLIIFFAAASQAGEKVVGPQSPVNSEVVHAKRYPRIVLYSVSWCSHCKEAKEYLTDHNIPFINRDVELDDKAMDDLKEKYKSIGVPVIVLGNDQMVIKGFDREEFEKALNEMSK
jgi:glutaredoxin-like YruB-family protein